MYVWRNHKISSSAFTLVFVIAFLFLHWQMNLFKFRAKRYFSCAVITIFLPFPLLESACDEMFLNSRIYRRKKFIFQECVCVSPFFAPAIVNDDDDDFAFTLWWWNSSISFSMLHFDEILQDNSSSFYLNYHKYNKRIF